jgi:hypothetical protein
MSDVQLLSQGMDDLAKEKGAKALSVAHERIETAHRALIVLGAKGEDTSFDPGSYSAYLVPIGGYESGPYPALTPAH